MLSTKSRTIEIIRGRYDPVTDTGYMGYIPSDEFITGEELIDQLNISQGTIYNSECGWLKFYVGPRAVCNKTNAQKILYVAKRPLVHGVSWDYINGIDLVYGAATALVHNKLYSVRLMTGGDTEDGTGSEWNELMYRVYTFDVNNRFNWEKLDKILDMDTMGKGGRFTWCQESIKKHSLENNRVLRHCDGHYVAPTDVTMNVGWRPVLELVE